MDAIKKKTLSEAEKAAFSRDGFLICEDFLDPAVALQLAERIEGLFRGDFETGLYPDEWNWQEGRDSPDRTRQICNGWKADRHIAALVLSEEVGRICAQLMNWKGARIGQDNVLWKPPGAASLGYHQDNSYVDWVVPPDFITCWIALDETTAAGGTLEYARGSHLWGRFPPLGQFHAPEDYRAPLEEAARQSGKELGIVPVEVPRGACAFHAGGTWHGSGPNRGNTPRRSLVSHCLSSAARFHESNVGYIYSRYKKVDSCDMEESFFPILWREDGYRSSFLGNYCRAL